MPELHWTDKDHHPSTTSHLQPLCQILHWLLTSVANVVLVSHPTRCDNLHKQTHSYNILQLCRVQFNLLYNKMLSAFMNLIILQWYLSSLPHSLISSLSFKWVIYIVSKTHFNNNSSHKGQKLKLRPVCPKWSRFWNYLMINTGIHQLAVQMQKSLMFDWWCHNAKRTLAVAISSSAMTLDSGLLIWMTLNSTPNTNRSFVLSC